jgi:restriction system protein
MAATTLRRRGELLRGLFEILSARGGEAPARDVLRELEQRVRPTAYEDAEYPNSPGVRRYGKVVRFSSINVVKAGWLVKESGLWTLTEEGKTALAVFTDPEQFYVEARRLYKQWASNRPEVVATDDEEEAAETDLRAGAATTLEESEEAAWEEIRRYVATMPPYEFQDLVGGLLTAMGYHVAWTAPPGPDRGIDLIAYNDPLGASGPRIVVQVKRRADPVAADELRSFMAVLGDRDVGLFIAVAGFTREAEREARSQERRRLTLIDLPRLVDLWTAHAASLSDADRRRLPLKAVYFLAPPE